MLLAGLLTVAAWFPTASFSNDANIAPLFLMQNAVVTYTYQDLQAKR